MKTVIVIPTRYASKRLPGKPLLKIAEKTTLARVYNAAAIAAEKCTDTEVVVATDDKRIYEHAQSLGAKTVMTPAECGSGTERAWSAVNQLDYCPDFVVNLQGDAPLTPPKAVAKLIEVAAADSTIDAVTLAVKLSWEQLDNFRAHKLVSPFSGTSVIVDQNNNGVWFSKNIIPALRNEEKLRHSLEESPVYRHLGVYGYRYKTLREFVNLPKTRYEELESLEQLRLVENGYSLKVVPVKWPYPEIVAGVDTIEDAKLAEEFIRKYGEIE